MSSKLNISENRKNKIINLQQIKFSTQDTQIFQTPIDEIVNVSPRTPRKFNNYRMGKFFEPKNEEMECKSRSFSNSARCRSQSSQSLKRRWHNRQDSDPLSIPRIVKAQHSLQDSEAALIAQACNAQPSTTEKPVGEKMSPLLL